MGRRVSSLALAGLVVVASRVHAQEGAYGSSSSAMAGAEAAMSALRSQVDRVDSIDREIAKSTDQLQAASGELAGLDAKLAAALSELRSGLFCDGCWQTRSEILARGESFPHPGQRVVQLSATDLAQREADKRREYEGRKASLQGQLRQLQARIDQQRAEHFQVQGQAKAQMGAWTYAMQQFSVLQTREVEQERSGIQTKIAEKQRLLASVERMLASAKGTGGVLGAQSDLASGYLAQAGMLRNELAALDGELERAKFKYETERSDWNRKVTAGRSEFQKSAHVLGAVFVMPFWSAPDLRISAGGFDVTVGTDKIGARFGGGVGGGSSAKWGVTAQGDWLSGSQSVRAELEGAAKGVGSGSVGIEHGTSFGADGATYTTTDRPFAKGSLMDALEGDSRGGQ